MWHAEGGGGEVKMGKARNVCDTNERASQETERETRYGVERGGDGSLDQLE